LICSARNGTRISFPASPDNQAGKEVWLLAILCG
jgi:hypothetical protein